MSESFLLTIRDQIKDYRKRNELYQLIAQKINLIDETIRRYESSIMAFEMQDGRKWTKELQEKYGISDSDEKFSSYERLQTEADKDFDERYKLAEDRVKLKNYLRYPNTEKQNIENLKLFFGEKYYLPTEPKDILSHLKTLSYCYVYISLIAEIIPQSMAAKLDNVALMIMQAGACDPIVIEKQGKTHDRLRKSKSKKEKKLLERKHQVIEAYDQIKNKNRTTHGLAGIISRSLHGKGLNPPSLNTIKKYLKEEGKI